MRDKIIKAVCTVYEAQEGGALDIAAMGADTLSRYVRTRDYALVKPKPGSHMPVFHLTEIPNEYMASWVMATDSDSERAERAFRCSVIKVDNMRQDDDVRVTDWTPPNANGAKLTPMSEADAYKFSPAEVLEIGGVAFTHSFLRRRTGDLYRLHASLAEVLGRSMLRLVDASPTDAAATSSDKPSPASDSSPSTGATGNDSATGAESSG